MSTPRYETHKMPHPMLPFIYHRRFELVQRQITPNWHENIELLQCTEGEGYVLCGPERVPLTRENLVIVNADTLHCVGTDGRVVYRCLIIDLYRKIKLVLDLTNRKHKADRKDRSVLRNHPVIGDHNASLRDLYQRGLLFVRIYPKLPLFFGVTIVKVHSKEVTVRAKMRRKSFSSIGKKISVKTCVQCFHHNIRILSFLEFRAVGSPYIVALRSYPVNTYDAHIFILL